MTHNDFPMRQAWNTVFICEITFSCATSDARFRIVWYRREVRIIVGQLSEISLDLNFRRNETFLILAPHIHTRPGRWVSLEGCSQLQTVWLDDTMWRDTVMRLNWLNLLQWTCVPRWKWCLCHDIELLNNVLTIDWLNNSAAWKISFNANVKHM